MFYCVRIKALETQRFVPKPFHHRLTVCLWLTCWEVKYWASLKQCALQSRTCWCFHHPAFTIEMVSSRWWTAPAIWLCGFGSPSWSRSLWPNYWIWLEGQLSGNSSWFHTFPASQEWSPLCLWEQSKDKKCVHRPIVWWNFIAAVTTESCLDIRLWFLVQREWRTIQGSFTHRYCTLPQIDCCDKDYHQKIKANRIRV